MEKQYLGDGVYAQFNGNNIELRANDAFSEEVIYIEPEVLKALLEFARKFWKV